MHDSSLSRDMSKAQEEIAAKRRQLREMQSAIGREIESLDSEREKGMLANGAMASQTMPARSARDLIQSRIEYHLRRVYQLESLTNMLPQLLPAAVDEALSALLTEGRW